MLTVDDYELIRRMHLLEGRSIREIRRRLGHSRNTIAKVLAHPTPPGYRMAQARAKRVLEPYISIIDAWLEQDKTAPRKQRHTGQAIYERLCKEHKYRGSVITVRRYLQVKRQRQQEVFMPLAFEPGEEAQVDWHEAVAKINGVERKVQVFCMRLCHSKASFTWPYERATLEAFLDGHVRAFAHFGGVPKRIAYDNLKSAVTHVGAGQDRTLNERFKHLRCHYLFDTRFCNVARGNEKGDVENLAKRSERSYLTPVPEVASMEALGRHMLDRCDADLDRPGPLPYQDRTRRQLLEEERRHLLPLQPVPFEACMLSCSRVDKRSLVTVARNRYSVPVRYAHHDVSIKRFADRVEVWHEQSRIARHDRSYEQGQFVLEPEHYLNLLKIKPGSLDNARAFKGQPWGDDFQRLRRELEYRYEDEGTRHYIDTLLLMTQYPVEQVKEAVALCVRRRAFSRDAVVTVLRNEPLVSISKLDLSHRPDLHQMHDGTRPLGDYDQLVGVTAETAELEVVR